VWGHGDDLVEFHEVGPATEKARRCPNVFSQ